MNSPHNNNELIRFSDIYNQIQPINKPESKIKTQKSSKDYFSQFNKYYNQITNSKILKNHNLSNLSYQQNNINHINGPQINYPPQLQIHFPQKYNISNCIHAISQSSLKKHKYFQLNNPQISSFHLQQLQPKQLSQKQQYCLQKNQLKRNQTICSQLQTQKGILLTTRKYQQKQILQKQQKIQQNYDQFVDLPIGKQKTAQKVKHIWK